MKKQNYTRELLDQVLEQIQKDVADGDLTAIEEMLGYVPLINLIGYLPEAPTTRKEK
jgi:hypothetical protein